MPHSPQKISRRAFMIVSAQFAALSATVAGNYRLRAASIETAPQPSGYGTGAYGQAAYVGSVNQVYLPLVTKGGE